MGKYRAINRETQRAGRFALLVLAAGLTGGCITGKELQDRHSMSRLWVDPESKDILFEATVSPDYPVDTPAAEEVRRDWMRQWLERQSLCQKGFAVVSRERLGRTADNPYLHDLRYKLRCTGV